jgi:hypothetical protein
MRVRESCRDLASIEYSVSCRAAYMKDVSPVQDGQVMRTCTQQNQYVTADFVSGVTITALLFGRG